MKRPVVGALFLHLAVLLSGMASLGSIQHTVAPNDVTVVTSRDRERVTMVAVVGDDPMELTYDQGERVWQFPVRVQAVMRAGAENFG